MLRFSTGDEDLRDGAGGMGIRVIVAPGRDYSRRGRWSSLGHRGRVIVRFKAAFFRALGYSRDDWEVLRAHLLQLASAGIAISQPLGVFGRKFEVSGTLEGPGGKSAEVTTIWIIRRDEDFPRFLTAYPT